MKVLVLYRPDSEMARPTESFVRDFKSRNAATKVEMLNIDEREAIATASLYDVVRYPAILVTAVDGSLLRLWQGEPLPLINEVAAYVQG